MTSRARAALVGRGRELAALEGLLVGRGRELAALEGLLAELVAGRGGVGWVEGEPGIGKSALVDALAARASVTGCVTLTAMGDVLTQAFPLRLMADCLGVSLRSMDVAKVEIARLLRGEIAGSGTVDPVSAAAERMLDLVDRLCGARPVVLIVDDLQWADEPSLELWNRLALSVDQIPLLLLGTRRPVPQRPTLERLRVTVQDSGGTFVDLGPLDQVDVIGVAARVLAATPGPQLSRELARAGGNPLYVRELVEALVRDGLVQVVDEVAELAAHAGATPGSLVAVIGRRLSFLSPQTLRALRMAALFGVEFGVTEWAAAADRAPVDMSDVVDEAVTGGVISSRGAGLMFRHDLIRQVLAEQTPPAMREELHRHVARVLAEAGHGVDVVAPQLLAVPSLDGWALLWLAEAPESMVHAAPWVSKELLERAVGLVGDNDPIWGVLASRLVQVHFWLGHHEEVVEVASAVLRRTTDVELVGRVRAQAVRSANRLGRFEDALALAAPALRDPALPPRWQARLSALSAMTLIYLGRGDEARVQALNALDQAERCDDSLGAGYARLTLYMAHPASQSEQLSLALAALGDDPESTELRLRLLSEHLMNLEMRGRHDDFDSMLPQALVVAERIGTVRAAMITVMAVYVGMGRGTWDDVLRLIAGIAPQHVDGGPLVYLHGVAAMIALRREQRDLADAHLRAAGVRDGLDGPGSGQEPRDVNVALAIRAEIAGDLERALARRAVLLDQPQPELLNDCSGFAPDLVRVALQVGDLATAKATAAACAVTDPEPTYDRSLAARCCQALVDDDANELLDLAEDYRRHGWCPSEAFSLEEASVRLARSGAITRAKTTLTQAVQIYDDLGATWDIRRAEARLRLHGIRRGPQSVHRRATHGWDALTPSELRIASLVAQGLSNPDIAAELYVSRATVQTHVSSILAKLSMRSRLELIRDHANRTDGR